MILLIAWERWLHFELVDGEEKDVFLSCYERRTMEKVSVLMRIQTKDLGIIRVQNLKI